MVELKDPWRYLDLLNGAIFSEGVNFIFGFTEKFFHVALNDLNHISMEELVYKPLIIHLEYTKGV